MKKLLIAIFLCSFLLSSVQATEQISKTGQASTEVVLSYGLTEEVMQRALQHYEQVCSLEDINNIRRHLKMPPVVNCNSSINYDSDVPN